jgi:hypothetical protein
MPMTFNGNGTITGLSAGGLPDSSIVTADIADAAITAAKMSGAQSGSAPIYGARAWVNFNGTGTVAIRASGNVSSITDNGTGDYTVNFTTAMPDANYGAYALSSSTAGSTVGTVSIYSFGVTSYTTSSVRIRTSGNSANLTAEDATFVNVSIFR